MKLYELEASFTIVATEDEGPIVEWIDGFSEELDKLGARDVSLFVDQSTNEFTVVTVIEADADAHVEDVVGRGMGLIRTAAHARNAGTPDWPHGQAAAAAHVLLNLIESSQRVLDEDTDDQVLLPA